MKTADRTATITNEITAVRGELTRVDAKCATLTGLSGAALAFLVTQINSPHTALTVRVLLSAAGVVLAGATLVLLLAVLRPRLGSTGFRHFSKLTDQDIIEHFGNGKTAEKAQRDDLRILSGIANRKFLGLRIAVDLIAFAVILIAFALILGIIL